MSILGSSFFGTPPEHTVEKSKEENLAVKAPEFDITQYVKKLSVSIGVLATASAGTLKLFGNHHITSGILAACLGVTAVGLLGVCLISAVDIAARAYVTRGRPAVGSGVTTIAGKAETQPQGDQTTDPASGNSHDSTASRSIGAPPGRALAWIEGDPQPRLVLAVAGDGDAGRYLLSGAERGSRDEGDGTVTTLEGTPSWHDGKEVRAVRAASLADWPDAPQT